MNYNRKIQNSNEFIKLIDTYDDKIKNLEDDIKRLEDIYNKKKIEEKDYRDEIRELNKYSFNLRRELEKKVGIYQKIKNICVASFYTALAIIGINYLTPLIFTSKISVLFSSNLVKIIGYGFISLVSGFYIISEIGNSYPEVDSFIKKIIIRNKNYKNLFNKIDDTNNKLNIINKNAINCFGDRMNIKKKIIYKKEELAKIRTKKNNIINFVDNYDRIYLSNITNDKRLNIPKLYKYDFFGKVLKKNI